MGTAVLLDLMGGIALLLCGLHMVQSGILRAFGSDLRHLLSKALDNPSAAFPARKDAADPASPRSLRPWSAPGSAPGTALVRSGSALVRSGSALGLLWVRSGPALGPALGLAVAVSPAGAAIV